MEFFGSLFNTIFLIPVINLLIFFYKILESAGVSGAFGFSIILLTVLIRFLVWPFNTAQIKSTHKMTALKPQLDELKKKYKDKTELSKAQMALYKEQGVNPVGGCLPTLIQFPILIALYQSIIHFFPESIQKASDSINWTNSILYNSWLHLDKLPDPLFFGLNLANKPSEFTTVGFLILLVPIVTSLFTFVQSRMMIPPAPVKIYPSDSPKEKKEKEDVDEMMASMQPMMLYMMPVMVGFFAFQFPVGLAIYWNMVTIIGIFQQYLITGWGGMVSIFNKLGIKVEEKKIEQSKPKVKVERIKK
jgi:YidC/Oxa1 family membrane protein insertase